MARSAAYSRPVRGDRPPKQRSRGPSCRPEPPICRLVRNGHPVKLETDENWHFLDSEGDPFSVPRQMDSIPVDLANFVAYMVVGIGKYLEAAGQATGQPG